MTGFGLGANTMGCFLVPSACYMLASHAGVVLHQCVCRLIAVCFACQRLSAFSVCTVYMHVSVNSLAPAVWSVVYGPTVLLSCLRFGSCSKGMCQQMLDEEGLTLPVLEMLLSVLQVPSVQSVRPE